LDVRAASDTYLLVIRKRKLPGPCRNCFDIPRSRHASQKNRQKCRYYFPVKSDSHRDGVSSDHTLANFDLHSNCHGRTDTDSFDQPDHSAPASVFENPMALYRHRPRRVGVGLPDICEMETEGRDCSATRVLCAFGLGRSADAAERFGHQLRVIFSFQRIRRPGPARD